MYFNLYQYVIILVVVLILRFLFRWLLALWFHLRFGHLGFFSITDVRYHQTAKTDRKRHVWSIHVGKIKFRLNCSADYPSSAWITLHISQVNIAIPDLVMLLSPSDSSRRKQTTRLHRRISQMGDSLKQIPWWYSLSIVKHILRFTSALPAQFVMAGLANYVDVQLDDFRLSIANVTTVKVDRLSFNSMLFTAQAPPSWLAALNRSRRPVPTSSSRPDYFSLRPRHQRHSLKHAGHIFKEKFFEITICIGPITFSPVDTDPARLESRHLLTLPRNSRIVVSCHLSAGCLTLKDIDLSTHIEAVAIDLDAMLKLREKMSAKISKQRIDTLSSGSSRTYKQARAGQRLLSFFRSVSFSVLSVSIASHPSARLHGTLELQSITATAAVESDASEDAHVSYKVQLGLNQLSWKMGEDTTPEPSCLDTIVSVASVQITASVSKSILFRETPERGGGVQDINDWNDLDNTPDWMPNRRFAKLAIVFQQLKLFMDVQKLPLHRDFIASYSRPRSSADTSSPRTQIWTNLPQLTVSVTLVSPVVEFVTDSKYRGHLTYSRIALDASGEYTLDQTGSKTNLERLHADHLSTESVKSQDEVLRKRKQQRSWANLFRRTWRGKQKNEGNQNSKSLDEWHYVVSGNITVESLSVARAMSNGIAQFPFFSLEMIDCTVTSQLFSVVEDFDLYGVTRMVWGFPQSHIDVQLVVRKGTMNAQDTEELLFWMNQILIPLKQLRSADSNHHETKKELPTYLSFLKLNILVKEMSLAIAGMDAGLKGKQYPPAGYLDNAPTQDIHSLVVFSVDTVTAVYTGSDLQGKHAQRLRRNVSNSSTGRGTNEETAQTLLSEDSGKISELGSMRLCLTNLLLKQSSQVSVPLPMHTIPQTDLMLWISKITTTVDVVSEASMMLIDIGTVVRKIGLRYTIANHYACLLLLQTLQKIKKEMAPTSVRVATQKSARLKLRQFHFQSNRNDIHATLPADQPLYLRLDGLRMQWLSSEERVAGPCITARNVMLFGVNPINRQVWDVLMELDDMDVSLHKTMTSAGTTDKSYQVTLSKLYLRIPYRYIMADIIDNLNNLVKSVKVLHTRLVKSDPFTYFGATEKSAPLILPSLRLLCKVISIHVEDDPFEVKLRMIWKTGLLEQSSRIALQDAFEAKAKTVKSTMHRRPADDDSTKSRHSTASDLHPTSSDPSVAEATNVEVRVKEAWQGLQQHNSKSWIKRIQSTINKEANAYPIIKQSNYRNICLDQQLDTMYDTSQEAPDTLTQLFQINITQLPTCPPLLDFTVRHVDLTISRPSFPIDQTRPFIHDLGKGVPMDTAFSTWAPFHITCTAGSSLAQMRDYPVPLLHVPPRRGGPSDPNPVAWSLSGDYVFADELADLDATRSLSIPIIKNSSLSYTIDIARTSSPPKFYSMVNINVHSEALSHICWSISYQPGIQDLSRALECLTRPPVDPSPKVGFWDKIRLMIHTRTKIAFVGGGDLAIVMKGTRNPYDMTERGFGLAKVWRNHIEWYMGYENVQGEFMQVISDDYYFGVPDLVHGGFAAPNTAEDVSVASNTLEDDLTEESKEKRFLKIALKLSGGIRMGLGCHLERVCRSDCEKCTKNSPYHFDPSTVKPQCRYLDFLPHYKVRYRTPQAVQRMPNHGKDYDTYAGFRSDYIHLSISIVKLSGDDQCPTENVEKAAMNSMHLTPGFLEHFVSWFRLFGGAMGYPMRNGSLFPRADPRPTQKFGKHMSTMKYKIMVDPLMIGYFYKDDNTLNSDSPMEEIGDSVGLKALVSAFSADIHQRREFMTMEAHKLDQKRLKANWPVHEAEVQLKNVDLRAVRACYSGESVPAPTADIPAVHRVSVSSNATTYDILEEMEQGRKSRTGQEERELADWTDLDDFVELSINALETVPNVQILPFAFSPYIYYLKQTNRDDVEKYRYLHGTHECIFGTAIATKEMQMSLLQERSENIDLQIRKHQARIHTVECKLAEHPEDKALLEESLSIVEKTEMLFEKRNLLQRYLKEVSSRVMPDVPKHQHQHQDSQAYSQSTIFGQDLIMRWEELMGHFKQRYIVHNPQILWNNSVRNIVYQCLDLQARKRALTYYMSTRAMKFLREVTEQSRKQRQWKVDQFSLDDNDGVFDQHMTEDLIEKLLSEQGANLYAPNETEDTSKNDTSSVNFEMSNHDNVNDADFQKNSIPEGYAMKSSYLVDLLNPQISLQSDCEPDNLVLTSSQRMCVKGFNIVDVNDPDIEMEVVKSRTIVSMENAQIFVAKKEHFDSVDLLLDNHYGAKENDHWLAWVPPEMLLHYVKQSDKFQRVAKQLQATFQYDKYNPLRIKTNQSQYARIHPFEDRGDSAQLNFPQLALTANSPQYSAIYEIVWDLLLYKEPAKKERLARLREIIMAADRGSLRDAVTKIIALQQRIRHLQFIRSQYRRNMNALTSKELHEFGTVHSALLDSYEELYLGMEAIKLTQSNQRRQDEQQKTSLKFVFSADKVSWEMLTESDSPLCEWNLTNTNFVLITKEDHSSSRILEIDTVHVKNTSAAPVFTDVLGPFVDTRKSPDFSRHKMLRCYVLALAPVGGIPVVQHLEINLFPLRLQMTYDFGKAMATYFFPAERRQKNIDSSNTTPSSSTTPLTVSSSSASMHVDNETMSVADTLHSSVAVPMREGRSGDRDETGENVISRSWESNSFGRPKSGGSDTARLIDPHLTAAEDTTTTEVTSNVLQTPSFSGGRKSAKNSGKRKTAGKRYTSDDLTVMKKRASSNRTFILVKMPGTKHCLSYQGPKEKNIEDLRDFAFQQPNLEYRNKTWSWFELMSNIKKDFMRAALLNNSKALLKEKLMIRRHVKEGPKIAESGLSLRSFPAAADESGFEEIPSLRRASLFETDNASMLSDSSRDDMDPLDNDRDTVSCHSMISQDSSVWTPETSTETKPRHTLLAWPRRFRKSKKPASTGSDMVDYSTRSNHELLGPSAPSQHRRSISDSDPASRSLYTSPLEEESMNTKGKLLLGKYYNTPSLSPTMAAHRAKSSKDGDSGSGK
ncbi:golgi-body localization protein domain-containing protein [Radiomyces spectabilis]|uniref:golgi-body localization protein domain-containing protein n=1 Tax=Radiomyces spectabilis TaxID=64574 RepID=UPI00222064F8|nr:golgi-body localization protein domain-containing protein [Radiomyces spectabilis]KAI8378002.1 golgi-body localization protein domain-containing protein [Radiomyces spectabilis]